MALPLFEQCKICRRFDDKVELYKMPCCEEYLCWDLCLEVMMWNIETECPICRSKIEIRSGKCSKCGQQIREEPDVIRKGE